MASVNRVILDREPRARTPRSATPRAASPSPTSPWPRTRTGRTRAARSRSARSGTAWRCSARPRRWCATTARKGRQVYLEGSIRYDEWTDKDGNKTQHDQDPRERAELAPGAARAAAARAGRRRRGGGRPREAAARGRPARRRLPGLRRRRAVLAASAPSPTSRPRRPSSIADGPWPPALPSSGSCRPTATARTWSRAGCALADENGGGEAARLLSVYASAGVEDPGQRRAHRGGLPPRRLRDPERPLSREIAREAIGDRPGPPRPRRGRRSRPAEVDLVVSVSCTGFMIPAVDAYVADALGHGAAPGPPAHHRERVRGRRGGPGARGRLPGAPIPTGRPSCWPSSSRA